MIIPRGLIVSLTPSPSSPWNRPDDIGRLAAVAQANGAAAVKVDGPDAIRAVRAAAPGLPLLAVSIQDLPGRAARITPTLDHARALADAGADVIELEADSQTRRADGQDIGELIATIASFGLPVKAGVGTIEDAHTATAAGATVVSSSTMGYPAKADAGPLPDLDLVSRLVGAVAVPVIAERGYATLDDVRQAFRRGAHSVVVGTAIVDPSGLTRAFAAVAKG